MLAAQASQGSVGVAPGTSTVYIPYASVADLRNGLGIVDPGDAWRTGRLNMRLPGTATLQLTPAQAGLGLVPAGDMATRSLSGADSSTPSLGWWLGAFVVAAAGFGGGWLWASRRRRGRR